MRPRHVHRRGSSGSPPMSITSMAVVPTGTSSGSSDFVSNTSSSLLSPNSTSASSTSSHATSQTVRGFFTASPIIPPPPPNSNNPSSSTISWNTPSSSSPSPSPSSTSIASSSSTSLPIITTIAVTLPTLFSPSQTQNATISPAAPSASSLSSRDQALIITLSVLVGLLSSLWIIFLIRRWRKRAKEVALAENVHPVSFGGIDRPTGRRTGNTESFACLTSLRLEDDESTADLKSKMREMNHHGDWSSPSSPNTPSFSRSGFSPLPDIFDTRWPGRHIALDPSQRISGLTGDGSQILLVSPDLGLNSCQGEMGSHDNSLPAFNPVFNPIPDDEVGGDATDGQVGTALLKSKMKEPRTERRTWDRPPPEESERGESSKTGPPAYSPGSDPDVPPLPVGLRGTAPMVPRTNFE